MLPSQLHLLSFLGRHSFLNSAVILISTANLLIFIAASQFSQWSNPHSTDKLNFKKPAKVLNSVFLLQYVTPGPHDIHTDSRVENTRHVGHKDHEALCQLKLKCQRCQKKHVFVCRQAFDQNLLYCCFWKYCLTLASVFLRPQGLFKGRSSWKRSNCRSIYLVSLCIIRSWCCFPSKLRCNGFWCQRSLVVFGYGN